MLKMTKIKLELIPDPDMYIFPENGTRGGLYYISNIYSKANNQYLNSYDPKKELQQIMHLKKNELYAYVIP